MFAGFLADGDRKRLQESLAGSFMRATDQDMGFGGGSVGLRQPDQAPDGIAAAAAPPAAAASQAAAAFLSSVGGRFASGGTILPEPTGLHTPATSSAAPSEQVSALVIEFSLCMAARRPCFSTLQNRGCCLLSIGQSVNSVVITC